MLPQQTSDERVEQTAAAGQLLKQGVAAFRAGDKALARDLIAQAAAKAPHNELVWMWTASTARNRAEALAALDRVLELNPDNEKAQQWLQKLKPPAPQPASNGNAAAAAAKPQAAAAKPKAEPPSAPAKETAAAEVRAEGPKERPVAATTNSAPAQASQQSTPGAEAETSAVEEAEAAQSSEETSGAPTGEDDAAPSNQLPPPVQERRTTIEDDPIRAFLQRKADGVETQPEEDASKQGAKDNGASESAVVERTTTATAPAEEATADDEAKSRPISSQTCLLCGKQSLTDGVCGYCRAVADISLLDEISRNDSVDRTAMLAAVDRFRKELEAGPNFEANLGLALAYLNMKQSNDALPRLAEACRLQPDNQDLRRHFDRLRARRLILVVDDSKTVQKMIAGVLEKELYRVVLADDGLQALARLDDETPSLILLDITMPRMDGYQVARIITGNDATASIPVIMLSGNDGFFDRIRGKLAGARGYVTKPFDPSALTDTIKNCLQG